MSCNRNARKAVLLIAVITIILGSHCAVAVEQTASLTGTVKDSTGAAIAGAPVVLTNNSTNVSRTAKTSADGTYFFPLVPIGRYTLTVEQPGFSTFIQTGITLELNQNGRQDVTLAVGSSSQVIEVKSDVAQVDTVSATLGKVESERRILDLPLVDRDTFQLGLLQAGVFTPDPDDGSRNPFSVSGQRSESLTFLINGVDNNDFLGNNAMVDPNPDAVAEFKILTNNYNAEYGRTSGGIVNQVIRSGGNKFHGSLFEFFRNDALNARDFFLPDRTPFKRNLFGGTVGGPIVKDKTFFFFSYQGSRRHEGQVAPVLSVLSDPERHGDFSELLTGQTTSFCPNPAPGDPQFDSGQLFNPAGAIVGTCVNPDANGNTVGIHAPYNNNQVPVNPVIAKYIDKYLPHANAPGNTFVSSPIGIINDNQFIVHIDHHFSDRDSLSGVYILNDHTRDLPYEIVKGASTGGNVPIGSGFNDSDRFQVASLTWTHLFTPRLINEAIFGANRRGSLDAVPHDTTSPADLGFTNVSPDAPAGVAPPIMFTPSFNLGPTPGGPTSYANTTFQWQDNVSWTTGNHQLKFGADFRRVGDNFNFDFFNNGSFDFTTGYTGNAFADFVAGFPDNYFQFSNAVYGIRTNSYYFYGQDTWKIRPRFTLNYGVRYEYNSPQTDPHNNILGWFPGQESVVFPNAPTGILYPGDPGTPNRGLVFPDKNNFAPRIGFAWDMFGNAKLVMRGGYGIFYDIEDGALNLQFGGQPPFGAVANFDPTDSNGPQPGVDLISDPFTPAGLTNPFPFASAGKVGTFSVPLISFAFVVDPHFRTPYSQNFNFGFQYQLTSDTMVEAAYVGSLGRKLISSEELNAPVVAIEQQQLANAGFVNPDCARPLGGCPDPTDPNGFATNVTQIITNQSNGLSDSHELQVTVDKRFTHGFNLRGAYTWAKTIDISSGFRARSAEYTDPNNPRLDRGLADFDATHRLVISGLWEMPWGKWIGNGVLHTVVEGWQFSGIATFQSGFPFTIYSNNDSGQTNVFPSLARPDLVGTATIFDPHQLRAFTPTGSGGGSCLGSGDPGRYYFDPTAFDCTGVPIFTFGTTPRNYLRGPGINNFDLSIARRFKIKESDSLEFRGEFFNAFNHVNFLNPDNQGGSGTFGQVTSDRGPRIIQLALKFYF